MQKRDSIICLICKNELVEVCSDWCPHCGFKIGNRIEREVLDENTACEYFGWLRTLLTFLPYLRPKPDVVKWELPKDREEGILYARYPVYCDKFNEFCDQFHYGEKWSLPPYFDTIEERNIKLPITTESSEVKNVDMPGLLALFYWSFRGERFCPGFMAGNVEDGIYVMLLERLKELLDDLPEDTCIVNQPI